MRVRVDIPELVPELAEFLRGRGYEVVSEGGDEITVVPTEPNDFRMAMSLLADLDLWRAKHPWATARLDPQLT
ncbi:MAG TPA: hypothetical protein VFR32_01105 [Gaiellaceae bacterium]|nr:hypothetical protein [Gaiellaceae bacterium]